MNRWGFERTVCETDASESNGTAGVGWSSLGRPGRVWVGSDRAPSAGPPPCDSSDTHEVCAADGGGGMGGFGSDAVMKHSMCCQVKRTCVMNHPLQEKKTGGQICVCSYPEKWILKSNIISKSSFL